MHEAGEAVEVAGLVERDVVVHGDAAVRQPARGAGDGAARVVQQHEALRVGGQQLGGQSLQRVGALAGRVPVPTASTRSAWRMAFSDHGVSSSSARNST